MGLMIGVELTSPCAAAIKTDLLQAGYLIGSVGDRIIRLLPPLILDPAEIPAFIAALGDALKSC